MQSLPSRERGLKQVPYHKILSLLSSLPSRERGLKQFIRDFFDWENVSLPSRERGLKPYQNDAVNKLISRSLRGSVD